MARHWKSCGAVPMIRTTLALNFMERFAGLDLIWGMTVSLPTRWNLRAVLLSGHQVFGLMGKPAESNGLVFGEESTSSAPRK